MKKCELKIRLIESWKERHLFEVLITWGQRKYSLIPGEAGFPYHHTNNILIIKNQWYIDNLLIIDDMIHTMYYFVLHRSRHRVNWNSVDSFGVCPSLLDISWTSNLCRLWGANTQFKWWHRFSKYNFFDFGPYNR